LRYSLTVAEEQIDGSPKCERPATTDSGRVIAQQLVSAIIERCTHYSTELKITKTKHDHTCEVI
jgi:hypothetical protein